MFAAAEQLVGQALRADDSLLTLGRAIWSVQYLAPFTHFVEAVKVICSR